MVMGDVGFEPATSTYYYSKKFCMPAALGFKRRIQDAITVIEREICA